MTGRQATGRDAAFPSSARSIVTRRFASSDVVGSVAATRCADTMAFRRASRATGMVPPAPRRPCPQAFGMSPRCCGTGPRPRPEDRAARNARRVHRLVYRSFPLPWANGAPYWKPGKRDSVRYGPPQFRCLGCCLDFRQRAGQRAGQQGYDVLRIFLHAIVAARKRGGLSRFF